MKRACQLHRAPMAVIASAVAMALGPAGAAGATVVRPASPAKPVIDDVLVAVSASSASNAWAIGISKPHGYEVDLAEHWNGKSWKVISSRDPGGSRSDNELVGVATVSASTAWAVGQYWDGKNWHPQIQHWNGKYWKVVTSPDPGGSSSRTQLEGVAATSAGNAWAVGSYSVGTTEKILIDHWNGHSWKQAPSPIPSFSDAALTSVAAVSASNAWAVGGHYVHGVEKALILHWNGKTWKKAVSPSAGANWLSSVTAPSASSAWAAGTSYIGNVDQTFALRWNGKSWKQVNTPDPAGSGKLNELLAVTSTSAASAWAVGDYTTTYPSYGGMILHWNGQKWRKAPGLAPNAIPSGLGPIGKTRAWLVGSAYGAGRNRTLTERWNGKAWKVVPSPSA